MADFEPRSICPAYREIHFSVQVVPYAPSVEAMNAIAQVMEQYKDLGADGTAAVAAWFAINYGERNGRLTR